MACQLSLGDARCHPVPLPRAGVRALVSVCLFGSVNGLIGLRVAHGLLRQVTLDLSSPILSVLTMLLMCLAPE